MAISTGEVSLKGERRSMPPVALDKGGLPSKVGPITIQTVLGASDGFALAQGVDARDQSRLVQVVFLEKTDGLESEAQRRQEEKRIARATTALLSLGRVVVHAHGGLDVVGGARLLYWILPHVELLPWPAAPGAMEVVGLARALAAHLAELHKKGRTDPLLHRALVARTKSQEPFVAGVEVFVRPELIRGGVAELDCTPTELEQERAEPAGDVLRLGRVLESLMPDKPPSEDFALFVKSLTRDEEHKRPRSGAAVLAALDGLLAADPTLMGMSAEPLAPFESEQVTSTAPALSPRGIDALRSVASWTPSVSEGERQRRLQEDRRITDEARPRALANPAGFGSESTLEEAKSVDSASELSGSSVLAGPTEQASPLDATAPVLEPAVTTPEAELATDAGAALDSKNDSGATRVAGDGSPAVGDAATKDAADAEARSGTDSDEAATKSGAESALEQDAEATSKSTAKSDADVATKSRADSGAKAAAETTAKSGVDSGAKSDAEATADSGAKSDAEATAKSGADSKAEPDSEATAESRADSGAKSDAEATAKSGAEADSEVTAESKTKSGSQVVAKSGADSEAEPGGEAITKSGADFEAKSDTEAAAKSGAEPDSEVTAESKTKSGSQVVADSEEEPGGEAITKSDADFEAKSDTEATEESGEKSEAKSGSQVVAESGADSEAKSADEATPDSEAEPGGEAITKSGEKSEAKSGSQVVGKSEADSEAKSDDEATADSEAKSDAEATADSEAKSAAEATADSGTKSEAKSGPQVVAKSGADSEAKSDAEATADSGAKSEAKSDAEATADSGTKSEAKSGSQVAAKSGSDSEAELDGAAATKSGADSEAKSAAEATADFEAKSEATEKSPAEGGTAAGPASGASASAVNSADNSNKVATSIAEVESDSDAGDALEPTPSLLSDRTVAEVLQANREAQELPTQVDDSAWPSGDADSLPEVSAAEVQSLSDDDGLDDVDPGSIEVPPLAEDSSPPVTAGGADESMLESWVSSEVSTGESPWSNVEQHSATPVEQSNSLEDIEAAKKKAEQSKSEMSDSSLAALKHFDPKKAIFGGLVVVAGLSAMIFVSRTQGPPPAPSFAAMVPADHEFIVESQPPGATIIAEADGRTLGTTPLTFMAPAGLRPKVFVYVDGHEPAAVEIAERGGVSVRLSPVGTKTCKIELDGVGKAEAVVGALNDGVLEVAGVGLVRARGDAPIQGARLVRCPQRGGAPQQELQFDRRVAARDFRVTEPAGASGLLFGEPLGRIPSSGRTAAAFAEIRIDDQHGMNVTRWVPILGGLDVRMPSPPARKPAVVELADPGPDVVDVEEEPPPPTRRRRVRRREAARKSLKSGNRALIRGRLKTARRAFAECLRLDPEQADCHKGLGTLYKRLKQPSKSNANYRRYLELKPDAADAPRIRRLIRD